MIPGLYTLLNWGAVRTLNFPKTVLLQATLNSELVNTARNAIKQKPKANTHLHPPTFSNFILKALAPHTQV